MDGQYIYRNRGERQVALQSLNQIASLIEARPLCHLFLDFDGTLAPIVARPDLAQLPKEARDCLTSLLSKPRFRLNIISGRSLVELERLVAIEGIVMAGNHGLEIKGPGINFIHQEARRLKGKLEEFRQRLEEKTCPIEGALVEDKGLTVSLHYRMVPEHKLHEVFQALQLALAQEPALIVRQGKKVLEVRPRTDWDKGRAVLWILESLHGSQWEKDCLPIYLGDDLTDEDAFRVLKSKGISIFVGGDAELTSADYYLPGPSQVMQFLSWLQSYKGVRDDLDNHC